ncbi:haloacid dehalogenase [Mycena maculata]|uniref:Haloacid dehalogenase n=1 Tax=Mycena maculata TaxID=230809 RepID=A0AAD7ISE9_9AGAR|nr:haloacid dehalogenase [Mycena maculata]
MTKAAVIFDLTGTRTGWKPSIVASMEQQPQTSADLVSLAVACRDGFFQEIHRRFQLGEPAENLDITHGRVLDRLLDEAGISSAIWGEDTAWPDSIAGIELLKPYFVVVLANGTTRLQLDIVESTGMKTVYVPRTTEKLDEDMDRIRTEFDAFVAGTTDGSSGGLFLF